MATSPSPFREVALRTEGYQPGDLETLVERAISHAELRTLNPMGSLSLMSVDSDPLLSESPKSKIRSHDTSLSSLEKEPTGMDIPSTLQGCSSPHFALSSSPSQVSSPTGAASSPRLIRAATPTRLPPLQQAATPPHSSQVATPPPQRKLIDPGGGILPSFGRTDSSQTVVYVGDPSLSLRKIYSLSHMTLSERDFFAALEGFIPVSLRGLPLHSAGSVDFSHIGGLKNIKETLTETLSWPSKVVASFMCIVFSLLLNSIDCSTPGCSASVLSGSSVVCCSMELLGLERLCWLELWRRNLDSTSSVSRYVHCTSLTITSNNWRLYPGCVGT